MKFIKLESRGGNYLIVAENVAWLRTAENGQTSVGIIGGQPLLVVGSIEEVAEKILKGAAEAEAAAATAASPVSPSPAVAAAPAPVTVEAPAPEPVAAAPAPRPEPEPELEPEPVAQEETSPPAPAPDKSAAPARPRVASARSASMWERPAATQAASLKIKGGSQRMMGRLE